MGEETVVCTLKQSVLFWYEDEEINKYFRISSFCLVYSHEKCSSSCRENKTIIIKAVLEQLWSKNPGPMVKIHFFFQYFDGMWWYTVLHWPLPLPLNIDANSVYVQSAFMGWIHVNAHAKWWKNMEGAIYKPKNGQHLSLQMRLVNWRVNGIWCASGVWLWEQKTPWIHIYCQK